MPPKTQILLDTFHVLRHLATAMDQVRRLEYQRLAAKDRNSINLLRYRLLFHRATLMLGPDGGVAQLVAG